MKTEVNISFYAPASIGGIAYGACKTKDGQGAVVGYKVLEYIVTDTGVLAKVISIDGEKQQLVNSNYLFPSAAEAERLADNYTTATARRRRASDG